MTSIDDGSSTSAPLTGLMCIAATRNARRREYTGIALEYGTLPLREVINALRADQWLENHPKRPTGACTARSSSEMRDAFYIDTDGWKRRIVEQAFDCAARALHGLSSSR